MLLIHLPTNFVLLMHFLRLFPAFVQKLCLLSFHFPKINKRGVGIRAGVLENVSKINKRGGGDYSVLKSTLSIFPTMAE